MEWQTFFLSSAIGSALYYGGWYVVFKTSFFIKSIDVKKEEASTGNNQLDSVQLTNARPIVRTISVKQGIAVTSEKQLNVSEEKSEISIDEKRILSEINEQQNKNLSQQEDEYSSAVTP